MLGGELSGDPADPSTPLGRFLASDQRNRASVMAMWAESGITEEYLQGFDPAGDATLG